jgi:hypothetical protein
MRWGGWIKGAEVGGDLEHGSSPELCDGRVFTAADHVVLGVRFVAEWTG